MVGVVIMLVVAFAAIGSFVRTNRLDRIGAKHNIQRWAGESDRSYDQRIRARLVSVIISWSSK